MRRMLLLLFAAAALLAGRDALAFPCGDDPSPFNDVFYFDSYCTEAAWAKNAGITVGCGDGSIFCPNDPVTRAQMVLFMRRLAQATFPTVDLTEIPIAPAGDLDGPGIDACDTILFPPSGSNAHLVHVVAVVWLQGGALAADVQINLSRSMDGASFVPLGTVGSVVTVPPGDWVAATVLGPAVLDNVGGPGTSSVWRIDLSRLAGSSTTGELAWVRCQMKFFRRMV